MLGDCCGYYGEIQRVTMVSHCILKKHGLETFHDIKSTTHERQCVSFPGLVSPATWLFVKNVSELIIKSTTHERQCVSFPGLVSPATWLFVKNVSELIPAHCPVVILGAWVAISLIPLTSSFNWRPSPNRRYARISMCDSLRAGADN